MFLNSDNRMIDQEMLNKGTLTSTVIILHNHPSGNPTPSTSDIRETNKVRDACKLMDISRLDHIVISRDSYFSFADEKISQYQLSEQIALEILRGDPPDVIVPLTEIA